MTRNTWHTIREGASTTVARRLPARFDVSASAQFPRVSKGRLAHQIRQDMWRALQDVRGFSPVVQVVDDETGVLVTAGGQAARPVSSRIEATIAELLSDTPRRARWIKSARKGLE